jgi:hypothetical protein
MQDDDSLILFCFLIYFSTARYIHYYQLATFLKDYKDYTAPQLKIKFEIYSRRVLASTERYRKALEHLEDCHAEMLRFTRELSAAETMSARRSDKLLRKDFQKKEKAISQKVKAAHFELPHKLFLPNGTSAALVSLLYFSSIYIFAVNIQYMV